MEITKVVKPETWLTQYFWQYSVSLISIIPEYILQVFAVASQYRWWAAIESTCQSQQDNER